MRLFHRQPAAAVHLFQRGAGNVFHRDEANAVLFRDIVDSDDIGMVEPGRGLRFLQESALPAGIGDLVRGQSFQGDDPVQARVARLIDLAHSSRPEQARIS